MFATPVPPLLSQEQHCFRVSTTHCSLFHQHVHLRNSQDHRSIKWGESEVAQSCPTLCDPVDCSLPGSSVHGILQARILEWVAIGPEYIKITPAHLLSHSFLPPCAFCLVWFAFNSVWNQPISDWQKHADQYQGNWADVRWGAFWLKSINYWATSPVMEG